MSKNQAVNHHDIAQRQNEERFISMLAAQRQLYREEKWQDAILLSIALISAVFIPLLLYFQPAVDNFWGLAGLALFLITKRMKTSMREKRTTAAKIQETFDTQLFGLPWNKALAESQVLPETVAAADMRHKDDRAKIQDWYASAKLGLPRKQTVLLCIRENFVWDYRQREKYLSYLSGLFWFFAIGALALGIVEDVKLLTFLLAFAAPLMPLLGTIGESWLKHKETAKELQQKAAEITYLLQAAPAEHDISEDLLRNYQDAVFKNRQSGLPVPDWFYEHMGKNISEEVGKSTASILEHLKK